MAAYSTQALLAVVGEQEPVEVTSLAETLGAHPITVDQQCSALQSVGHIRQVSPRVYELTIAGQEYLADSTGRNL